MMGLPTDGDYPRDGGDFGRCEGLLNSAPELRARIHEMATVNSYWAALAPQWDTIRQAEDKTAAIRAIIRPIQDKDRRIVRLASGATIEFGRPE